MSQDNDGSNNKYVSESQQSLLRTQLFIGESGLDGVLPKHIAEHLSITPSMVTRHLANLEAAGVAEKDERTGHWRLTERQVRVAQKFMTDLMSMAQKLGEYQEKYGVKPS